MGQGALKHGFTALQGTTCTGYFNFPCSATAGTTLGVGCSDPYCCGLNNVVGSGGPNPTANYGRLFIALKPQKTRDNAAVVIGRLRQKARQIPGMQAFFQSIQNLNVGGRPSKSQYQYVLQGSDTETLYRVSPEMMACCVILGFESVDTRSNAAEAARWIAAKKVRKVRLVTTDWHMRRAAGEIARTAPEGTTLVYDAVASHPSLFILFLEYHKLIASRLARLWGG
jgi:hypothetical protein